MTDRSNGYSSKSTGGFNANAREFVPNPNANSFVPGPSAGGYNGGGGNGYNRQQHDMNARCGEVVDILADVIGYTNPDGHDDDYDANLNDEELFEMLEMQEECRKEMMKTYVQANNPTMFEDIYYNVAYPDEAIIPQQAVTMMPPRNNNQQQQQQNVLNGIDSLNINDKQQQQQQNQQPEDTSSLSVIDLVKTNLNPDANEFVPKKYVETVETKP